MLNIPKIEENFEILRRFLEIINLLAEKGPMGFRKISEELDLPPHIVKHALSILQLDFLTRTSGKGTVLSKNALEEMKLIKEDLEILKSELEEIIVFTDKIIKTLEQKSKKK